MFKYHIDKFLKIQQESSGLPSHCFTDAENMSNIEDDEKVGGERQLKKILDYGGLVSQLQTVSGESWGINEDKVQRLFITDVAELNKLMAYSSITIRDFSP